MKLNDNKHIPKLSITIPRLKQEDGFVFVVTAVVVSVILGFTVLYVSNSVSMGASSASELYSSAQAHWTALSGIDFALEKKKNGTGGITGSFTFFNSSISLSLSSYDRFGASLNSNESRVVSTAMHGTSKRIMEVTLQKTSQSNWPSLSLIEDSDGEFDIDEDFTLNDSLYIGEDVEVDEDASMGDSPGERTHLYVPSGKEVDGEFDSNFSWSVHPSGSLNLPDFSFSEYDSLITIANSISSTSGNKYKGNYTLNGSTLDLSSYQDNTFFINGKLTVKGGTISGGTVTSPGFVVVSDDVEIKRKNNGSQSTVNDDIIIISDGKIKLKDQTQFGVDRSGTSPENRPETVNEIYAADKVIIGENAEAWAQVYSKKEIELEGSLYGLIYTKNGLEFEKSSSFFEGALFVKEIKKPEDKLEKGSMDLNHYYPKHYFSESTWSVVPYSLREI